MYATSAWTTWDWVAYSSLMMVMLVALYVIFALLFGSSGFMLVRCLDDPQRAENKQAILYLHSLFCAIFLNGALPLGFSMHEWALAEAVIVAASEIAEKEGLSEVTEVKIKVGELQQIELDVLDFALSQLKPVKFKNAKFNLETAKAELKCRVCGNQWTFQREKLDDNTAEAIHFVPEIAHTYIKCPKCGSPDFEILAGRGVWLESIKGVKEGDD